MNTAKLVIKIFFINIILIINAHASASSSPWTMPIGTQFFKTDYYNDYEIPLIDPLNDTATNLSLILSQKSSSKNINSEYISWFFDDKHSATAEKIMKDAQLDLKYPGDVFNESTSEIA